MSNLTHLFKVGQKVTYRNNDFDAVKQNIPCVVKETYPDHIIITDTETDTDLWIEEGLNMDCVYPEYNMIGGLIRWQVIGKFQNDVEVVEIKEIVVHR